MSMYHYKYITNAYEQVHGGHYLELLTTPNYNTQSYSLLLTMSLSVVARRVAAMAAGRMHTLLLVYERLLGL